MSEYTVEEIYAADALLEAMADKYPNVWDRANRVQMALTRANARIAALEEHISQMADFAVGNGDVCELIARRSRKILQKAEAENGR